MCIRHHVVPLRSLPALPFDLAVHPPSACLFRFAGGFDVAEQVSGDECTESAGGE